MAIEIVARKREMQGTGPARRLRRQGRVPGIVYGGEQGPVNIELDHKDLYLNLRNERFHASILSLEVAGAKEQVLLRAVTMHPYRPQVEHVDFQRVQKNKKLHMKVPLHFVNAEKSPGVKDQGGVVSHVLNEIDITCLPDDLPRVRRGRPRQSRGRQLDPRARPQAAERRRARRSARPRTRSSPPWSCRSSSPRKKKSPRWSRRPKFRPPSRPPTPKEGEAAAEGAKPGEKAGCKGGRREGWRQGR